MKDNNKLGLITLHHYRPEYNFIRSRVRNRNKNLISAFFISWYA